MVPFYLGKFHTFEKIRLQKINSMHKNLGGHWTVPQLPIPKDERNSKWNKPLAMIQAFLVPIAVSQKPFSKSLSVAGFWSENWPLFQFWVFLYQYNAPDFGPVPRYAVVLICSSVFSILIFCTSDLEEAPVYWSLFPFIGFAMGMLWIYIQANEVLNILTALGKKICYSL